jgi:hypothetical protein
MTLSVYENNAIFILKNLFENKKLFITSTTLKNKLLQEPTFPSLLSLSNVLTDFSIYNVPIAIKPEQLTKIPYPTIAYLDNGMGYVSINKVENNRVEWWHDQLGKTTESIADFSQKWQGLILIVKPNENTKEENYEANVTLEKIQKLRTPFIYAALTFILGYSLYSFTNFTQNYIDSFYSISLIKIVGLICSIVLLRFNIYADKSIVDGNSMWTTLKNNVIRSLISDNRKIFGGLNWSEIGLIYFVVGITSLLLIEGNNGLVVLKWFNLISIPYTIWAIYYQAFVTRKRCLICLGALLLIWSEFYWLSDIPLSLHGNTHSPINIFIINLLLITIGWVFMKKHLYASMINESLYFSFQKTKFSTEYVRSLFSKEHSIPPIFEEMQTVLLGNPESEHTLLAVLNPNSTLAAMKFNELLSLATTQSKINFKIILVPDSLEDTLGIKIIKNILAAPVEQQITTLSFWFEKTNFKKCNFTNDINESEKLSLNISANINWVFLARISSITPMVFLNNNILPSIYTTKEIPILLRILNSKP